ncbi:hypothetical protein DFP72DRAFT_1075528 [Ephemerocybe angulata]|uniref:Uncharacterized protein n=1 Tax=Ephemerocybe angulata TaxID=980116 RepID=A0A8H6M0H8_9AGAR|nr:hypothetical protein DFP72DRAFT_1075528 [Tulosesus angulatus]
MSKKPSAGKKKQKLMGHLLIPGLSSSTSKGREGAGTRTLRTVKMKVSLAGGYKVCHTTQMSAVNVSNVPLNDSRTTEEILKAWLHATQAHGWEQGYVNSFLEHEQPPPEGDPETNPRPKVLGDKVTHDWKMQIDSYMRVILTLPELHQWGSP